MKALITSLSLSILFVATGYALPEPKKIPVQGATSADWNKDTFWYEPWGSSGVHKGMDIFAKKGEDVLASTNLVILFKGEINKGGKVVLALGPKWRIHYFAHMDSLDENLGIFMNVGEKLGEVGNTGNAQGKPAHLHYSVRNLIPNPSRIDDSTQGHKKAFFINPIEYLQAH
ncbi:M23 family metallopeptidase [Glaciecola sp. 1036]|uniref:M23 family metallopeptidase n=1 Tax=Alteromonadaceae TaxID=72275 RepID=UPI003D013892